MISTTCGRWSKFSTGHADTFDGEQQKALLGILQRFLS